MPLYRLMTVQNAVFYALENSSDRWVCIGFTTCLDLIALDALKLNNVLLQFENPETGYPQYQSFLKNLTKSKTLRGLTLSELFEFFENYEKVLKKRQ